ncbi:DUF58 domain-containing protein [Haloferacaceae archaeon DSL9]
MRPTRRGIGVLVVCVGGLALGASFGARELNALVLPGFVALVAAYVQLRWLSRPAVERTLPADGFVGGDGAVELQFRRASDGGPIARPFVGTVTEHSSGGLTVFFDRETTAVGSEPLTYTVQYGARGRQTLGPATVRARDVFGLMERTLRCPKRDRLVVYPSRRPIPSWFVRELATTAAAETPDRRAEFDYLREYGRGDSLRDVHWATTAKQGELVVKEFVAEADAETVSVAARSAPEVTDAMAEAATSISLALLEAGQPVAVTVPAGETTATPGVPSTRTELLELLATTGAGTPGVADADIVIDANPQETTVRTARETYRFDALTGAAAGSGGAEPARAVSGGSQ